ncbi:phage virion morphogenesis protein [Thaumasiovibrio sp. DFM-14]|uniref:phage virion morphogenesis protein n=1 Tax=Thaumasiovibrio sp. DFM-14 TaxID=3384792 RepID=UPI0039A06169
MPSYAAVVNYRQLGGTPDMHPQNAAIPARPWLGTSSDDIDAISEMIVEFLQGH